MYKLIANKNWLTMLEILIDMNAKGLSLCKVSGKYGDEKESY